MSNNLRHCCTLTFVVDTTNKEPTIEEYIYSIEQALERIRDNKEAASLALEVFDTFRDGEDAFDQHE
jgi:hypothetical protein